jgi:hypothetical protein
MPRPLRWLPSLAALGLGVAIVLGVELLLRAIDVGGSRAGDPQSGFSRRASAFRLEEAARGPAMRKLDFPGADAAVSRFRADKPRDGFRIFVVGGSSVAGVPYG